MARAARAHTDAVFEHLSHPSPALWLLLPLLLLAIAAFIRAQRWFDRQRRRRIARRAQGAERAALELLRSHGYVVLDTQVRHAWPVQHGEQHLDINLRADALVTRDGRRFIAEIKSTALVADLKHGPTRRQLLEYAVAYGATGVLLVDMHAARIDEISFPQLSRPAAPRHWSLAAATVVTFGLGLWLGLSR